ncbi:transposase [Streptomyces sp. DT203]|uniref:transposase n=1 Tax=Streptomyces sp. DT203 TaxID=3393424 RepID=UPI003CF6F949
MRSGPGLVDLASAPEHPCGHCSLYGAFNEGPVDVDRLRRSLAGLPLPGAYGRLVLAVDGSPRLRPDAASGPSRVTGGTPPGGAAGCDPTRYVLRQ